MNVLIVGSGGRETCVGLEDFSKYPRQSVFVAPGNAGTAIDAVTLT